RHISIPFRVLKYSRPPDGRRDQIFGEGRGRFRRPIAKSGVESGRAKTIFDAGSFPSSGARCKVFRRTLAEKGRQRAVLPIETLVLNLSTTIPGPRRTGRAHEGSPTMAIRGAADRETLTVARHEGRWAVEHQGVFSDHT